MVKAIVLRCESIAFTPLKHSFYNAQDKSWKYRIGTNA